MTHLLIDNNGTMKQVDVSYKGISDLTKAKMRCLDDWNTIMSGSDLILDLIEPSNLTLTYLAIALNRCRIHLDKGNPIINLGWLKKSVIVDRGNLAPYIDFANQVMSKVDPDSEKFAYKGAKALVAKKDSSDDFYTRLQIIFEAVFYDGMNEDQLDIYVSKDFDVPYILNMYANITQWSDEQYAEYEKIIKEESAKVESESAEKTEESIN